MTIHKLQREILDCYWLQLSNRTKKILKAHDVIVLKDFMNLKRETILSFYDNGK